MEELELHHIHTFLTDRQRITEYTSEEGTKTLDYIIATGEYIVCVNHMEFKTTHSIVEAIFSYNTVNFNN